MSRAERLLLIQRLRDLADQHDAAVEDDQAADTADTLARALERGELLDAPCCARRPTPSGPAMASTRIVEFDPTEMACRILEGMIGHKRPAGATAAQALAELDQEEQNGLLRAAGRVMLYVREQTAKGVRPS